MSNKRDILRAMWPVLGLILGALLCLALSLLMSGCKTRYITQEVPVVVEHTSTQYHTDIVRDTLLMRDSVFHFVQGDTTIIERFHTIYKVERVAISDTIRDTIPKVVTVTKTEVKKENKMNWWQTTLATIGGVASVLLLLSITYIVWRVRA